MTAMTATISCPGIPHYIPAPATQEDLDCADLAVIDLSKVSTPEGRVELAKQARDAMREQGFFYAINHGLPVPEGRTTERIFDIGDVPFSQVPDEEKLKYNGRMLETGSYQGYKLRRYWHIDGGVHDQVENYNINRDVTKKEHPTALRPLLPEIARFAQFNHFNVLHVVLRLLAMGLDLPEDIWVNQHEYDAVGETYVRFMKYYPRSEEEEEKTNHVWLKGHTDFGSITVLWSQPVCALQILSPDGKWRWVRHMENALVINAGDCLEFLSGGFYKATIHRVVQPPVDQRGYTRLGVFYFAIPDDNVRLIPVQNSPILAKYGVQRRFADSDAPIAEQWRKGRTAAYGKSDLKRGPKEGVEEEYINGVLVKHYN